MEMLFLIWRELGMGKFPWSSLKVHSNFPINGLAVIVKKNFPIYCFTTHGKYFFTIPAKPFLGKQKCAFCDSRGIIVPLAQKDYCSKRKTRGEGVVVVFSKRSEVKTAPLPA